MAPQRRGLNVGPVLSLSAPKKYGTSNLLQFCVPILDAFGRTFTYISMATDLGYKNGIGVNELEAIALQVHKLHSLLR